MKHLFCCLRPDVRAASCSPAEQRSGAGPAGDRAKCRAPTGSSSTETPIPPFEPGAVKDSSSQVPAAKVELPRWPQQNFRLSDDCTAASAISTAPTSPFHNPYSYFLPLISDENEGSSLLQGPDVDALANIFPQQPNNKLEFADLCGSLEDLAYLAEGSNGVVYSASWRGARVAVKFLLSSDGDSAHLQRCYTEAVLTRVLSHPCVVQCFATAISQLTPEVWDAIRARCQRHRALLLNTSLARSVAAAVQQEAAGAALALMSSDPHQDRGQQQQGQQQGQQQRFPRLPSSRRSSLQGGRDSNPRDRSSLQLQLQQHRVLQLQQQPFPRASLPCPRSQPQLAVAAAVTGTAAAAPVSSSRLSSPSQPRRPQEREGGGTSHSCDAAQVQVLLDLRPGEAMMGPRPAGMLSPGAVAGAGAVGGRPGSSCPSPFRACPSPAGVTGGQATGPLGRLGLLGPCPSLDMIATGSGLGLGGCEAGEGPEAGDVGDLCGGEGGVSVVQALTWLRAGEGRHCTLVVMEFMDAGTLHHAIGRGDFTARRGAEHRSKLLALLLTAQELAQGMAHLHGLDIIHGDLKPTNVLLRGAPCTYAPAPAAPTSAAASTSAGTTPASPIVAKRPNGGSSGGGGGGGASEPRATSCTDPRGYTAKIADLGLARACSGEAAALSSDQWGALAYLAPEAAKGSCCKASDVYSFGVMLWEMAAGVRPYLGLSTPQVLMGLVAGTLQLTWPSDGSLYTPLRTLAVACTDANPAERPTFEVAARVLGRMVRQVRAAAAAEPSPPLPQQRQSSAVSVEFGGRGEGLLPTLCSGVLSYCGSTASVSASGGGGNSGLGAGPSAPARACGSVVGSSGGGGGGGAGGVVADTVSVADVNSAAAATMPLFSTAGKSRSMPVSVGASRGSTTPAAASSSAGGGGAQPRTPPPARLPQPQQPPMRPKDSGGGVAVGGGGAGAAAAAGLPYARTRLGGGGGGGGGGTGRLSRGGSSAGPRLPAAAAAAAAALAPEEVLWVPAAPNSPLGRPASSAAHLHVTEATVR